MSLFSSDTWNEDWIKLLFDSRVFTAENQNRMTEYGVNKTIYDR